MSYDNKIKELKIVLPEAKPPVGNYVATKISGKMLFVSGQISIDENGQLIKGKIGKDLDSEAGYNAAKRCALSIIAQVKKACDNDLSKIKIDGYIYEVPNFLISKKIPVKFNNTLIRKSLYFTRNVLQNKFFIPNNLLFPKSRVVLENYFN